MNDDFDCADEEVREALFFVEDDSGRFATGDDEWCPTRSEMLTALARLD